MIAIPFVFYITLLILMNKIIEKVRILQEPANKHISSIIKSTIHIVTIMLSVLMALSIIGIDIQGIIASLGLMTFAIGLALKDVITSIFSSYALMLYRPFQIGDVISIKGITGTVINMDTRHTILDSENDTHYIPNAEITSSIFSLKKKATQRKEPTILEHKRKKEG